MSARDDYPVMAGVERIDWSQSDALNAEITLALDNLDRLQADLDRLQAEYDSYRRTIRLRSESHR